MANVMVDPRSVGPITLDRYKTEALLCDQFPKMIGIVAVAVLAASAGGLPPVVSITGAGRLQEPPASPTALGVVVSSDEFQPR
jgi:hypothetical protein